MSRIMQPASLMKLDFGPSMVSGTTVSAAGASGAATSGITGSGPVVLDTHAWLHLGVGTWMLLIWAIGCAILVSRWVLEWLKLRAIVVTAAPMDIEAPLPVRESATSLEPGVCGILAPVLLLPRGIATHLTSAELDSILEHELCHWWRRDNLTGGRWHQKCPSVSPGRRDTLVHAEF